MCVSTRRSLVAQLFRVLPARDPEPGSVFGPITGDPDPVTCYNQTGMVKTRELIPGLPMTQLDPGTTREAAASPTGRPRAVRRGEEPGPAGREEQADREARREGEGVRTEVGGPGLSARVAPPVGGSASVPAATARPVPRGLPPRPPPSRPWAPQPPGPRRASAPPPGRTRLPFARTGPANHCWRPGGRRLGRKR